VLLSTFWLAESLATLAAIKLYSLNFSRTIEILKDYSSMADIQQCLAELKASFNAGKTRPIEWRKKQLQNLWHLVCV
jgi:hypothetical protein